MSELYFSIPELKEILSRLDGVDQKLMELDAKLSSTKKEPDKIIDAKEVCRILNISKKQLYRMETLGKIKYHKPNGGKRSYFLKDIHDYMKSLK